MNSKCTAPAPAETRPWRWGALLLAGLLATSGARAAGLDGWTVVGSDKDSVRLKPATLAAGKRFDVTVLAKEAPPASAVDQLRKRAEMVFAAAGTVQRCDPARTQLENLTSLICAVARKDGSPALGMALLVAAKDGRSQPILALSDMDRAVLDRHGEALSELAAEARERGIAVPIPKRE
jgi:hypothetical protein